MRSRDLPLTVVAVALLLWGRPYCIATPDAQSPRANEGVDTTAEKRPTISNEKHKGEKKKHWSGTLVDADCMAKQQSEGRGTMDQSPAVPRREQLREPVPENQVSPAARSAPHIEPGQSPRSGPLPPGQSADQNPDISQAEAAQMAHANTVHSQAKQCVATTATTSFGLLVPGGQLVKFDDQGNAKTSEALKTATLDPGRGLKAKVTGTLEGGDTLRVSAVELIGKRSLPATQGGR